MSNGRNSDAYARRSSVALMVLICAAALSGCGGGGDGEKSAASSTPSGTATTPPATTTPPVDQTPQPVEQTHAPTISGAPLQAVNAASSYAFMPSASDADNDVLHFSVANKPAWADFDSETGRLSGTPTLADVGSYAGIVITVSDGTASRALPAFTITVTQVANGNALLSWTPPTQNVDGSPLTGLSGYRIYYGTSPGALERSIEIDDGLSSFMVDDLSPATWYFRMTALADGSESEFSAMASKTIS